MSVPKAASFTPPYGAVKLPGTASLRLPVDLSQVTQDTFFALGADKRFRLFTPDLTQLALLLTGYAAFVHRVTGDVALTLNLPAHNRLTPAHRQTPGLFVEVLPLTLRVAPEDSFAKLFDRVKQALGDFLRHAKPDAIAAFGGGRPGCVLNFIQARFGPFAGHRATVAWLHSGAHDQQHPMRLHATDFDGTGLRLSLDVNTDILGGVTTPSDIADHFKALITAMAADPDALIGHVSMCAMNEAAAIERLSRGPAETALEAIDVISLIAQRVADTPEATAVRQGARHFTYAALWEAAGNTAAQIVAQVSRPGPVAVHMGRSIDCVIAILGVLRAGRAFIPISANTPSARVRSILNDAAAGICDAACRPALEASGTQVIMRDDPAAADVNASLAEDAYILYTSGSTGAPKGVAVGQAALARYALWAARVFTAKSGARYPFFSSLSFDLTLTSIFAPLVSGGSILVYPETGETDLAVLDVFAEDAVDVVKLTPSHLSLVCESGRPVERIKSLVLGGENLSRSLCRRAHDVLSPDIEIINEYGPTEAVVGAMIHRFDPARDTSAAVPIGRPADGMRIVITDAGGAPVPFGVVGEISIAGRLARGYHGQTDLTARAFCTEADGTRWYRSGDLGRLRPDGTFEYLGRADKQLKIGGVRIETAEIENAARRALGVKAVHVAASEPLRHAAPEHFCSKCALPDTYPGATFNADGLCMICEGYESYRDRAQAYFAPQSAFADKIAAAASKAQGIYDVVMLLSGGKDSTYAAYQLAAFTKRVLAVTLDNGFISDGAKENIARVVADLGWDHRYLSTDKMNAIFVDSLKAHSNVCQGCFKALYTLAIRTARREGAPVIVTGLSRGQFFETRLTPELFQTATPTCAQLEDMVTEARRRYHSEDDAVAQLLETGDLADGRFLEEVEIVDIYRYVDVPVSEIYRFLAARGAWQRPSDTGRSTNCLINDAGIYVHQRREGYHNYALPYSWDVRMGHKTRDQAMAELDDTLDATKIESMLAQIGFEGPSAAKEGGGTDGLTVYVAGDVGLSEDTVMNALKEHLPREARPARVVVLETMPLTPNGKVDQRRLPRPVGTQSQALVPPQTEMERMLAAIITEVKGLPRVGRDDDFYDLGIDSLTAIQIAMKANAAGVPLPVTALFDHRRLDRLAIFAEGLAPVQDDGDGDGDDGFDLDLDASDLASIARTLS
ncbi:MAG: amino acid adenylation domain-containing protein [Pseudomonadota bacterium]